MENFGLYQVFTKFSPLQNVSRENVLKKIKNIRRAAFAADIKLVLSVKLKVIELLIVSVVYRQ